MIGPSGNSLVSGSGALVGSIFRDLVQSGTYEVVVSDGSFRNDQVGSYDLYLSKQPGSDENEGGVLQNGQSVSDRIDLGDLDSYTFAANAGDSVYFRVADTETTEFVNSAFEPVVTLFDPSGSSLVSGSGALVGSIFRDLVETGTYTVVVRDASFRRDQTGSYDLYFSRQPGSDENEGGVLQNGQSVSDRIDLGDLDSYTFAANAGDSVYFRVADTETTEFVNSAFEPVVTLFDPSGSSLVSGSGALVGSIFRDLVETGTYTVVVRDASFRRDQTGSYDLYFSRQPGSDENEGGVLQNGQSVSDRIDLGDLDSYTFAANAGDSVYFRVADTETTEFVNSAFEPVVTLFDPSGSSLVSGSGPLVGSIFQNLVETGTYTVVVRDASFRRDQIGSYDLYFSRQPGSNEGGGISGGDTRSDFIDLGDIDSYAFTLDTLGTSVTFTVTDLDDSGLQPRVEIFGPSGAFVSGAGGQVVAEVTATLNQPGVYSVLVLDRSFRNDQVGNYQITGQGQFTGVSLAVATCNGLAVTVDLSAFQSPTQSDDVILGTSDSEQINGLGGNDTICAGGGNDTVLGGDGADWIDGQAGSDSLYGEAGDDMLFGDAGGDRMYGGPDNDEIDGESGNDLLYGQRGNDTISGGPGRDGIDGGPGADQISTGRGSTVGTGIFVTGGGGRDMIIGGPGADDLRGSGGNDTIEGGPGNDLLAGNGGRDFISGGEGDDIISGESSRDRLNGDEGNDRINAGSDNDEVNGGPGDDFLNGSSGDDVVRGNEGDDTVLGGNGNDVLAGGPDEDLCDGNSGVDSASACEDVQGIP